MKGVERFVCAFDNHGDKADPGVVEAFFQFVDDFSPSLRIHGGDCFDFRCLRKGRTEQEGRDSIADDIEQGIDFIRRFRPTAFLRGNHDERLVDAINGDDRKLSDFASYVWCDIKDALGDAVVYPYCKRRGVMRVGNLSVLHGYHTGIYAARHAATIYGTCAMGHVHASDQASVPHLERVVGHTSGALCALDMEYNRSHVTTLRQSNGWIYGLLLPNGDVRVWHADVERGTLYLPSEMREVRINAIRGHREAKGGAKKILRREQREGEGMEPKVVRTIPRKGKAPSR